MILRIVRARVAASRIAALDAAFGEPFRAVARSTPGLVRFHVGTRPIDPDEREVIVVSFWATVDAAVTAFGGDLDAAWTLDVGDAAEIQDIAYFEVDETMLRRSTADVAILRLTIGRVARGADAEIQRELRGRMHALEPEMTEAYVGRRILGDAVEIAFISAWEREAETRPLNAPFWPEISAGYDAFEIATFDPVASGAPV